MLYILLPYRYSGDMTDDFSPVLKLVSIISWTNFNDLEIAKTYLSRYLLEFPGLNLPKEFIVIFVNDKSDGKLKFGKVICKNNGQELFLTRQKDYNFKTMLQFLFSFSGELEEDNGEVLFIYNLINSVIIKILLIIKNKKGFYWSQFKNGYDQIHISELENSLHLSELVYNVEYNIDHNKILNKGGENIFDATILGIKWNDLIKGSKHLILNVANGIIKQIILMRFNEIYKLSIVDCLTQDISEVVKKVKTKNQNNKKTAIILTNLKNLNYDIASSVLHKLHKMDVKIIIDGSIYYPPKEIESEFKTYTFPTFNELKKNVGMSKIFLFLFVEKMKYRSIEILDYGSKVNYSSFEKLLEGINNIQIMDKLLSRMLIKFNYNARLGDFEFWYLWQKELKKLRATSFKKNKNSEDILKAKKIYNLKTKKNKKAILEIDKVNNTAFDPENINVEEDRIIFQHIGDQWVISGSIFNNETIRIDYTAKLGLFYMLFLAKYYDINIDSLNKIKHAELIKNIFLWKGEEASDISKGVEYKERINQAKYDFFNSKKNKNIDPKYLDKFMKIRGDFKIKSYFSYYKCESKIKIEIDDKYMPKPI